MDWQYGRVYLSQIEQIYIIKLVMNMGRKAVDTRSKVRQARKFMFAKLVIFFFLILSLVAYLVWVICRLNMEKGDVYEKKVLAQQSYVSNVLLYRRGDIVDRNKNKLATSRKVYNLVLDPALILSDKDYLGPTKEALKKAFSIEGSIVDEILKEKAESKYCVMDDYKRLDSAKVEEFEKLQEDDKNIKGVWFEEEYIREYPYGSLASKVIGFCASENEGSWGLENQYNKDLNGSYGRRYGYFDSDLELVQTVRSPSNGNTVVSTIDINVQGILEEHMKKFQKNTGSNKMGCIIMNPKNGEIYAMSSYPEYDLNNPRDLSVLYSKEEIKKMSDEEQLNALNELWRNYCISDAFEPGSTFKPITVSAALDCGAVSANQIFHCDGGQQVADCYIRCVSNASGGHGTTSLCQSLMWSCNDVLMKIGEDMGKDNFLDCVNRFGFGVKTGIDLPGESAGGIFTNDTMHSVELATSSFGQGQTVTMIQLAAAFCAVVNGGDYYEPHLVKEIDTETGALVSSRENMLVKKVVTEDTSRLLREFMYKTVHDEGIKGGTATPAQVYGYEVGGKTGTAEKHPTGHGNYLVSFIGFTPVEEPEVVIYVVIDEPNVSDQAHSVFATEFSSEIMREVLPLLGQYADKNADSGESSKKNKNKKVKIKLPSNRRAEMPKDGLADEDYPVADNTVE